MPRFSKTCSVAVERFIVMKWMPGAPSASSSCASSVVISTPTSRTAAGSPSTASSRDVTAVGTG